MKGQTMIIKELLSNKGSIVHMVGHDQPFGAALRLMHEAGIGSVVVVQTDTKQLLGLVSQPEILSGFSELGSSALNHCVTGIMRKPVPVCHVLDDASEVMQYMTAERTRQVLVLNEKNVVCGIVSIGDIVAAQLQESKIEADILRDMARSCMLEKA